MKATAVTRFASACASGPDWGQTVKAVLDRLGGVRGANLGFLYITDALAPHAMSIVTLLRGVTGIRDWVGTVGLGVCGTGEEVFGQPGIAILAAHLPEDGYRLFATVSNDLGGFRQRMAGWVDHARPVTGLIHGDPHNPQTPDIIGRLAEATDGFLLGGLSASHGVSPQFTCPTTIGSATEGPVTAGGVSGVLFGSSVTLATALTQGCSPIGPVRTITASEEHVIKEIDGRPALEVFKQDIGELLARDLRRIAGYIFTALPIAGSDTGDYLVRDILGIDRKRGWLAVGEKVEPGRSVMFTRRDRASAAADMERMLDGLSRRLKQPPKGGIYVSCLARGPNLFEEEGGELKMIQRVLGDVPLAGFFASGEISHNRLYGYTGVLTLFL